jgi:hypothetical protein
MNAVIGQLATEAESTGWDVRTSTSGPYRTWEFYGAKRAFEVTVYEFTGSVDSVLDVWAEPGSGKQIVTLAEVSRCINTSRNRARSAGLLRAVSYHADLQSRG